MQIPETINVLGFTYKIIQHETFNSKLAIDGKVCSGVCDLWGKEIHLSIGERDEQFIMQTLVHEIVHIIERTFDGHNEHTNLTEWQIEMIATGITSVIFNNRIQ